MQNAVVYRNKLLPYSETFVLRQMEALTVFRPHYLGGSLWDGPRLETPPDRTYLVNPGSAAGKAREALFKLSGWIPQDVLQWAKSLKPALVHAHFAPDGFVAIGLARRLGVPLVVSFHGTDITMEDRWALRKAGWMHRLYALRRRKLVQAGAAFIVPSEFMRGVAIKRGFSEEKIHLVRYGINLEEFDYRQARPERGHVLYVGRLIERKGLHYLIRALGALMPSFPEISLTVIGGGPKQSEFEELARKRLGNAARFLGPQPPEVVKKYLKRAYLFSMPSVTLLSGETESFGLVYVEAQAMAVPVVAFAVGGVPEVVEHGVTGFLAPERDVEALAEYIAALLRDPDLRNQMGAAGRRRVESLFDLRKNVAVLEKVYEEVLAHHGAPQSGYSR